MRFQISGKQLDVGEALQARVRSELSGIFEKYAQRPTDAVIVFSRGNHGFVCEASVHLSTGFNVAARGEGEDAHVSLDDCREKMDRQVRRYKGRLRDHHERVRKVVFDDAPMYVLAPETGEDGEVSQVGQPIIIAEMGTRIPSLSVGEAVMQMELSGAHLLVFRNEKHGRVNVVHRREDGNVGWIDPSAS